MNTPRPVRSRFVLRVIGMLAVALAASATGFWIQRSVAADDTPLLLQPRYFAGQTLHYQFEIRSDTSGHASSPISDPEAANQLSQSSNFLIRLDVLDVKPGTGGAMGPVRIRVTYEKVTVLSQNDAYDPQSEQAQDQLRKLEGHSIEFTLQPGGGVTDVTGLDGGAPSPATTGNIQTWMATFGSAAAFPKEGISVGKRWSSERPLLDAPLAGTIWREDSTYLRNEACEPGPSDSAGNSGNAGDTSPVKPDAAVPSSAATAKPAEECALILTHFQILQTRGGSDMTPDTYKKYGLRTTGKWTGAGETLQSVSLRTGLISSITQTSNQDMDFIISTATAPGRITYEGHVNSRMHVALLPESQATQPN